MRKSEASDTRPGRLIGYARVSTPEQSVQMQIDALVKAGVPADAIYREQASGVSARRHQLALAIKSAREGDTLVVWKLDRIGRSLLDLLDKLKRLEDAGVGFRSLTEGIDTTTAGGRLIMHVMGALSQFERDLVVERTRAGVRAHIARGGKIGRERVMTEPRLKEATAMLKGGATVKQVARHFRVTTTAIYHYFPGHILRELRKPD